MDRRYNLTKDFTLQTYNVLLDAISNYQVITVRQYFEKRPQIGFVILRHDVDRFPRNALRMANLEASRNIYSTYYFRVGRQVEEKIIREIAQMGHEIGYHYEVLSKADGNYDYALKLFKAELERLRSIYDIKTICMHGSPLSKWDNSLLWTKYPFEPYGIIGDGQISIKGVPYFTDAGRSWDGSNNIRDYMDDQKNVEIKNTLYLVNLINNHHYDSYYLNIHPERWAQHLFEYVFSYLIDYSFNIGKRIFRNR